MDEGGQVVEHVGSMKQLRYVPLSDATTLTSTPIQKASWSAMAQSSTPSAPTPHHILSTIVPRDDSISSDTSSISDGDFAFSGQVSRASALPPVYQSVRHAGLVQRSTPQAWANPSPGITTPRAVMLSVASFEEGQSVVDQETPRPHTDPPRWVVPTEPSEGVSFAQRRQQLRALAQAAPLSPAEEHEQLRQNAITILADQLERLGGSDRPASTLVNEYLDMGAAASAPLLAQRTVLAPTSDLHTNLLPGAVATDNVSPLDSSLRYKRASLVRARQGLSPTGADLERDVLPSQHSSAAPARLSTPQRRATSLLMNALAQWRPASSPEARWQRAGRQSRLFGHRTSYSTPVRVMNPSGTLGVAEQVSVREGQPDWVAVYTDVQSQMNTEHVTVQMEPAAAQPAPSRPVLLLGGALGLTTGSIVDDAHQGQGSMPARSVRSAAGVRARVQAWRDSNERMQEVRNATAVLNSLKEDGLDDEV